MHSRASAAAAEPAAEERRSPHVSTAPARRSSRAAAAIARQRLKATDAERASKAGEPERWPLPATDGAARRLVGCLRCLTDGQQQLCCIPTCHIASEALTDRGCAVPRCCLTCLIDTAHQLLKLPDCMALP